MNTALRESALSNALISEAIRLIEETGPLDDAGVVREAFAAPAATPRDPVRFVTQRALALGQRLGLQAELQRARHAAPWIAAALVLLIVLAGLSLAGSVVGANERRINIMVALVSLLGVHALTLLLWLAGLLLPLPAVKLSLGWLWLALTARVAGGQRGQAPILLQASTQLLARARLMPWAFGLVSHSIWALSFVVVLTALLFALAFRSYTLNWETTILDPDFFVRAVRLLGWAPGWLGFPVPDAATVLAPGSVGAIGSAGQRDWALWLTGCIVVYGLLPRLFFGGISALVWQRRRSALQPDLQSPYYRTLMARINAMTPTVIVDGDPGGTSPLPAPEGLSGADTSDAVLLVGFELPPETPWPPALPSAAAQGPALQTLRIDGSAPQRRELLDTVARLKPRALLIACHAASSPDRGTERLLRELMAHCGECRLWLVSPVTPDPGDNGAQRWRRWLGELGLNRILASDDLATALTGWR